MEQIKIIKHENPIPVNESGYILYPFEKWETASVGDGWNSKITKNIFNKDMMPLSLINKNPWTSLKMIKVSCFEYEEKVKYVCPHTLYVHYWCLPLYIFCNNINIWIDRLYFDTNLKKIIKNQNLIKKEYCPTTTKGLKFDKIQRTLLGSGITEQIEHNGGNSYIYDTILRLENNDYIGCKVWVFFEENYQNKLLTKQEISI